MITTLTLNPAIDRTLIVEHFETDCLNRAKNVRVDAGGKGINASLVIHSLGESTAALGFLGGNTGRELVAMLKENRLENDFVWLGENTRTNIKIVDAANNTCTDINEAGPYVSREKLSELEEKVLEYAQKSDMLIFSGNAQQSVPPTVYKTLIEQVRAAELKAKKPGGEKIKIILDASGALLEEGVKAVPWLIKPNISELSDMLGMELGGTEDIVRECRKLNATGITYICVSMGSEGLLLVTQTNAVMAKPPKVAAKSTVGAGDCVVGSLAVSLLRQKPPDTALRLACAMSAVSVTTSGTEPPKMDLVHQIYEKVEMTQLY